MAKKIVSKIDQLVFRGPRARAARLPLLMRRTASPLSSSLFLINGFLLMIILGTVMLVLPASSASGEWTSPVDAAFTATSAICVTGLTVVDPGTYWSGFGQVVIMALFQIGGLGFIIGATLLLIAIGGRFGLKERIVMSETIGVGQPGGVLSIITKITIFSLTIEAIGAIILQIRWAALGTPGTSPWAAIFDSVSAYNNCGMDLSPNFSSFSAFQGDAVSIITIALLAFTGSTGYFIFADLFRHRTSFRFSLETKIVIITTLSLLVISTLFYMIGEYSNPATLGPMPFMRKALIAFFQSVTARSAGFTVANVGAFSQATLLFTIFLMIIGGASGSVTGGVKVNTVGVLAVTIGNLFRGKEHIEIFGRQLSSQIIYRALTFLITYLAVGGIFILALSITEAFPVDRIIFEVFSALGTVGLSTGITPDLSIAGRFIIIATMFAGRVGPLVFMAFLAHRKQAAIMEYPNETLRLG